MMHKDVLISDLATKQQQLDDMAKQAVAYKRQRDLLLDVLCKAHNLATMGTVVHEYLAGEIKQLNHSGGAMMAGENEKNLGWSDLYELLQKTKEQRDEARTAARTAFDTLQWSHTQGGTHREDIAKQVLSSVME